MNNVYGKRFYEQTVTKTKRSHAILIILFDRRVTFN